MTMMVGADATGARCRTKLETYKRLAGEPDTRMTPAPVVSPWQHGCDASSKNP